MPLAAGFVAFALEPWRVESVNASSTAAARYPNAPAAEQLETLLAVQSDAAASASRRRDVEEAFPEAARLTVIGVGLGLVVGGVYTLPAVYLGALATGLVTAISETPEAQMANDGKTQIEVRFRWGA